MRPHRDLGRDNAARLSDQLNDQSSVAAHEDRRALRAASVPVLDPPPPASTPGSTATAPAIERAVVVGVESLLDDIPFGITAAVPSARAVASYADHVQHPITASSRDHERIAAVSHGWWIGYPRATAILKRLDEDLDRPLMPRRPSVLVVGEPGSGKTWIMNRMVQRHPPDARPSEAAAWVPVVRVQMVPHPSVDDFFEQIHVVVNGPPPDEHRPKVRLGQVIAMLGGVGTRMLLIDEFHNVMTGPRPLRERMLTTIKFISNELGIMLVCAGVRKVRNAVALVPELATRFDALWLECPWIDGEVYQRFLASLALKLPLRRPSPLTDVAVRTAILIQSSGRLSDIVLLVARAAEWAIRSGYERVDTRAVGQAIATGLYIPPAVRLQEPAIRGQPPERVRSNGAPPHTNASAP